MWVVRFRDWSEFGEVIYSHPWKWKVKLKARKLERLNPGKETMIHWQRLCD